MFMYKTNELRLMKIRVCEQKVFCVYTTLRKQVKLQNSNSSRSVVHSSFVNRLLLKI